MPRAKSKYEYFKLDDFHITTENAKTKELGKVNIKHAYSVLNGQETIKPDWYDLIVHRQRLTDAQYVDYPNCWIVSERTTGMIIADSVVAEKPLKTRDEAVDCALERILLNAPTQQEAMNVLQDVRNKMAIQKRKQIEEALNTESD